MRIPLRKYRKKAQTAHEVIQAELQKAHDIHPGYLMAGSIISSLAEAGFTIIAEGELDAEIALAHQAGYDEGSESVGSAG